MNLLHTSQKRVLVYTQAVDSTDPVLGFFHRWLLEFAKHTTAVTVVCLRKGVYDLPPHVTVISLGKEEGRGRFTYLWRFYRTLWERRGTYDVVFVHMNQIYAILGGWLWWVLRVPVFLWYSHRHVSISLRLALPWVTRLYTQTSTSTSLQSKKVTPVGHGIDCEFFTPAAEERFPVFTLLYVGRITAVKRIDVIVDAVMLAAKKVPLRLIVVGDVATQADIAYKHDLVTKVNGSDSIVFVGSKTQVEVRDLLRQVHCAVNATDTSSFDKTVLEAWATEVPVVAANPGVAGVYKELRISEDIVPLTATAPEYARALIAVYTQYQQSPDAWRALQGKLRGYVLETHNLSRLVTRILDL